MLQKSDSQIYIIGAGFAGQMIAQDLRRKKIFGTVAAFLDDDKSLIGKIVNVKLGECKGFYYFGELAD